MDKYPPITTHAELAAALIRGLALQINFKGNSSASDYQRHEPGPKNGWVAASQDSARRDSADAHAFATCCFNWRAVGEHDLSAPATPAPLTNADLNPGDIVRFEGKDWRVQGIDDNAPDAGLLLLVDAAEPEDADDFTETTFGITRGSNRRPKSDGYVRWRWASAGGAELVSRGEPKPDSDEHLLAEGFGVTDAPRTFHISVTINADTPEGYAAALETLSRGVES